MAGFLRVPWNKRHYPRVQKTCTVPVATDSDSRPCGKCFCQEASATGAAPSRPRRDKPCVRRSRSCARRAVMRTAVRGALEQSTSTAPAEEERAAAGQARQQAAAVAAGKTGTPRGQDSHGAGATWETPQRSSQHWPSRKTRNQSPFRMHWSIGHPPGPDCRREADGGRRGRDAGGRTGGACVGGCVGACVQEPAWWRTAGGYRETFKSHPTKPA